ncbi:MAG: HlyD family type I secretion periplasmic adaptor subunit [Alphaproteobacteria bacterium]|nr:HlyD family type I secretion periplasmic adaptor subunit [Alphaproteobacteria bacterium]
MTLQTVQTETLPTRPLPISFRSKPRRPAWGGASRFGYAVIILFFGVFGGWAFLAPLASGVTANGAIEVRSGIKTVQHLEGGLVKEILVREGDRVIKGQVLLRLDPIQTDARSSVHRSALISHLAEEARLHAEVSDAANVTLSAELVEASTDPELAGIIEAEIELFHKRRDSFLQQQEIRKERIEQISTEVTALRAQVKSVVLQLELIEDELAAVQELYDKKLTTHTRLLEIQRARAHLQSQLATVEGSISSSLQRINEHRLGIGNARQVRRSQAAERLNRVDFDITRTRENLGLIDDQLRRIDIRAPADGRVNNMTIRTVGGVVNRADRLMEIVPDNEDMVLEAEVQARDIEQVHVGAEVRIHLSAFNPRTTPPVDGVVQSVSASTIRKRAAYAPPTYKVVITLDPEALRASIGDTPLTSGMPAMGIIKVGERTMFDYLISPLTTSFATALREP